MWMYAGQKEEKGHGYSKAAAEVCKYALKFGDLSVEKTWEAFKVLKGKRLTGSFGLLWGVKIPDTMTDDMPEGDLPYLEMLYKFAFSKKSYYDLVTTRHVEPKETDRMRSEEEESTDRHDRMRMLIGDYECEDGTERSCDARVESATYRPQQGRKKPTGESHHRHVFGFVNESEDGTDIYIILIYSSMLNVGY